MPRSEQALGLFLFSSVIAISYAGYLRPTSWILRPLDILPHTKSAMRKPKGNLITSDSNRHQHSNWRSVVSKDVAEDDSTSCEVEIINDLNEIILFCWISHTGELMHYYPINDGSIKDGSVKNSHVEFTFSGHSFICIKCTEQLPKKMSEVPEELLLFLYTPYQAEHRHVIHLTTKRKRFYSIFGNRQRNIIANLEIVPMTKPGELIITANKPYECMMIHGFTVNYEKSVLERVPSLLPTLSEDLEWLVSLLPEKACKKLQASTPFWINESLVFGTVSKPIVGHACTFHPVGGKEWLRKMGMNENKEGGIEIYCAQEYLGSRDHWGPGGVLIHEMSHAYHNKHCPNGYDCEEIRQAYNKAMKRKLYDCVPVHGPQGKNGNAKAYACTNCMEFFAELSVAYHWHNDETTEYNKWFPYNRHQLVEHDPESFQVLDKYWMNPDYSDATTATTTTTATTATTTGSSDQGNVALESKMDGNKSANEEDSTSFAADKSPVSSIHINSAIDTETST